MEKLLLMHSFILEPSSYSACREECCFYLAMLEESLLLQEEKEMAQS